MVVGIMKYMCLCWSYYFAHILHSGVVKGKKGMWTASRKLTNKRWIMQMDQIWEAEFVSSPTTWITVFKYNFIFVESTTF